MHLRVVIVGALVAAFGLYLVVAHGVIFGYDLIGALGLNSFGGGTGLPIAGYGVGTIVLLMGLGVVWRSLTTPDIPKMAMPPMPMLPYMAGLPAMAQMGMMQRGGDEAHPGAFASMTPAAATGMSPTAATGVTPAAASGMASPPPTPMSPEAPAGRFCPACGRRNDATAAFCQACGKPMPPPT